MNRDDRGDLFIRIDALHHIYMMESKTWSRHTGDVSRWHVGTQGTRDYCFKTRNAALRKVRTLLLKEIADRKSSITTMETWLDTLEKGTKDES